MKIKFYVVILISICAVLVSCKKKINPTLDKPLMTAVQAGDFAQVKKLVGDGADVNANIGGLLPLVEAINKKYTDIARFLVDEEVNVNLQDKDGDTALIVAALRGNMEILPLLKKQGADFNIRNKQGKTALMYGVFNGSLPVVEYLLNNGADVVQQDNTGEDAVSMAIRKKDENTLKLLLVNGGAVTLKHLKLAFELLCVPNNTGYFPFYKSLYPKVTRLLEKEYLIINNVNYSKVSRLVKTILSEDGYRITEQYDNGVIKIFNAKDNSFIKAFGNLQFIKEIRYVLQNKMYINKLNNFNIDTYDFYKKFILEGSHPGTCGGTQMYGIGRNEFRFLNIDENKLTYITPEDRYEDYVLLSNTGQYYIIITYSHVAGIINFAVYNYQNGTKYISAPSEMRLSIFGPYGNIPYSYLYHLKFSKNDKYLLFTSGDDGRTIFAVFDVQQKKAILAQEISHSARKGIENKVKNINFSDDNKAVLITFEKRNVTRIPLP